MDYNRLDAFRLENHVTIVTGAGDGIGRGIAELFAQAGSAVVVSDRNDQAAVEVAQSIKDDGGKSVAVSCDVTNDQALENLIKTTLDTFGKITLLVNNAGGGGPKPFSMPMDTFVSAFKLNVFSVFRLCQLCAPHMESAGGGAILNVSSMSADEQECEHGRLRFIKGRA
jgi:7-alpha-hydroxysteroid dehydrogenase